MKFSTKTNLVAPVSRQGFTIVELLIVIVVIGILAAITIVAYNGIQDRANDTAVQSDLANARKKIEAQKTVSTSGTYGATPWGSTIDSSFSKNAYTTSTNNLLFCYANDGSEYGLIGISKSGKRLYVTNTKSVVDYTGAWTSSGTTTCPDVLQNNTGAGTFTWAWGHSGSAGWSF